MDNELKGLVTVGVICVAIIGSGISGCMYGYPRYNVYKANLDGEAELAQANQNCQIKVAEAQAAKESAQYQAEAEVIRAQGVAKANEIIANGLGGPEGYLRYLYIDMLRDQHNSSIIYVPTEAGLPILEAGKRDLPQAKQ